MKIKWIGIILLGICSLVGAEAPWRFLVLADWHSAEKYVQSGKHPDWFAEAIAEDLATVKMLKANHGGELILLPGDSNSGHWVSKAFINKFEKGLTPEQAILKAGRLCYSGMIDTFRRGGYSRLLMAVGDHEMGDNPWPAGSVVARCQPQFREAFAREFNMTPDRRRFLYEEKIGQAPSRPLGTKYEKTSYAYRYKNVLFVTVDAFHQESLDKVIGDQGSVTGTVVGKHLQWLENVLSEARKDKSIRHIFVQAHLPVIYPVRKVNSSGMMMDGGTESPFWKTLRRYGVDIYFAGEVHANTVSKDPESDLVQVVSRGNFFSNFMTVDVSDNRIELTLYNQIGEKPSDGKCEVSGRLLIDKSAPETEIRGEGELALLDSNSRLYYFNFEEDLALQDNPIVGLSGRPKKKNMKQIRGVKCSRVFPNLGTFGKHYSALKANVEMVDGIRGRAGRFGENSRMAIFAMGPHYGDHAVSYALWVRTTSTENQVLINSGGIWGSGNLKGFFNLNVNDGVPEVMVSKNQWLSVQDVKLNDGQWHHIAVSMPRDGCRLSEVRIYVDGKAVKTRIHGNDLNLRFNQSVRLSFGGFGYSAKAFDRLPVKSFTGDLDEICIWTRPLTTVEVASLSRCD